MPGLDDLASELESIARHLRRAGDGELVRELTQAMRKATDGVPGAVKASAAEIMPKRGGYSEILSEDLNVRASVSTSDANPRVSMTCQAKGISGSGRRTVGRRRVKRLNAGILEHPLYGDRAHWYTQEITPGFFTTPCREALPGVRDECGRALEDIFRRAVTKGS